LVEPKNVSSVGIKESINNQSQYYEDFLHLYK
jgi:hypothetical protein